MEDGLGEIQEEGLLDVFFMVGGVGGPKGIFSQGENWLEKMV